MRGGAWLCTHEARSHNSVPHAHARSQCQSHAPINHLSSSCRANPSLRLSDQDRHKTLLKIHIKQLLFPHIQFEVGEVPLLNVPTALKVPAFPFQQVLISAFTMCWEAVIWQPLIITWEHFKVTCRRALARAAAWLCALTVAQDPKNVKNECDTYATETFPGANLNNEPTWEKNGQLFEKPEDQT